MDNNEVEIRRDLAVIVAFFHQMVGETGARRIRVIQPTRLSGMPIWDVPYIF
jgi:hypothetical protein